LPSQEKKASGNVRPGSENTVTPPATAAAAERKPLLVIVASGGFGLLA
jgi:hypothetical protein